MKKTNLDTCRTSYFGTVLTTTVNNLIDKFGKPSFEDNCGEDKVNVEWNMETSTGKVFTIYDWKEYREIDFDEEIHFHIGGFNQNDTTLALIEITKILSE